MRVTACVVNWNMAEHLPGVLDTLLAQSHPDLDVVVVDNDSADGSVQVVRAYPDVRLVRNRANLGFAGAANQGVALAGDALLVCNPDVVLDPDYVARALATMTADPRCAAVQGKLHRPRSSSSGSGRDVIDTTGHVAFTTRLFRNRGENDEDRGQYDTPDEVFGTSGACALYRTAALHDVAVDGEVFDADLFAFWEDVDLDWRLQLRGWRARYTPEAVGRHQRGGSGPRRSALVERLNFTNRFLVVLKNDDWRALAGAAPGVAVTTVLKAGELAVTVPSAFLRSATALRAVPRILAKRRTVHASATVASAQVVERWFQPFDYRGWFGDYARRMRRQAAGAA